MKTRSFFWVLGASLIFSSCRWTPPLDMVEVEHGLLYRSGQLTAEEFKKTLETQKIKTVINLRGAHPGESWFDFEFSHSEAQGVRFFSLDSEIGHLPHRRVLLQMIDIFLHEEPPFLIHCDTGVDRTGEAAALWMMVRQGESKEVALEMLSEKFNYSEKKSDPSKKFFIEKVWQDPNWAVNSYDPCHDKYSYYPQNLEECTEARDDQGSLAR